MNRRSAFILLATILGLLFACATDDGPSVDAWSPPADTALSDISVADMTPGPDIGADTRPADDAPGATDTGAPDEGCPPPPPAAGAVRARSLGCEDDLPRGPLVSAVPGDIVLENALARFVIRALPEGVAAAGLTGGNLIDAVRLDATGHQWGRDGILEYIIGASFHLLLPESVTVEEDGASGVARVRVTGTLEPFPTIQAFLSFPKPPLALMHEYVLYPDRPVIEIWTHAGPPAGATGPRSLTMTDIMLWGGDLGLFLPGHGLDELPETVDAPVIGLTPLAPEWDVPAFATGSTVARTLINAGAILATLYSPVRVPSEGGSAVRYVSIGGGDGTTDLAGALAAVQGELGAELIAVVGQVQGHFPGVQVEVQDAEGAPLSRLAPAEDGSFQGSVPATARRAAALWIGNGAGDTGGRGQRAEDPGATTVIPAGGATDLLLSAPTTAQLEVVVTDEDGAPSPFRLTAIGPAEAAGPGTRYFVAADGGATYRLPPGTYELWLSRGPEYDAHQVNMVLAEGETSRLEAALRRVVRFDGWVATDLHVHSEYSTDSSALVRRRFIETQAEGVDYLVATEHDYITDLAPYLEDSGLRGRLLVRSGVEVSTMHLGHFNLWPIAPDPSLSGNGAVRWFDLTMTELFDTLRAAAPSGLVMCNHPRFGGGYASYFGAIDLGPDTPVQLLGCDLLEIINGIGHSDTPQVFADWLMLLDRGVFMTATGTSDSHTPDGFVGNARTLVYVGPHAQGPPNERVASVTEHEVESALRAGRAVASAGPFVELFLESNGDTAGIGDTLAVGAELTEVQARVVLQAPAWMALGTLELRADGGETLFTTDLSALEAEDGLKRFEQTAALAVDDTPRFVVAYHHGAPASRPMMYRPPWVVTNPVFAQR